MTITKQPPRIGVALGGGSARGYAHIGALASLERHGLTPEVVVGTSFGAIIGALYAMGKSTDEIAEYAYRQRRRDMLQLADFGLHKAALFGGDKLEAYFHTLTEGCNFSDLDREFAVVATDLDTGERVTLRDGSLARALRASSALPGFFAPVEIGGRCLVDGGLGAPVPLSTLEGFHVDIAIGIGVGIENQNSAAIRFAQRCLQTAWGQRVHKTLRTHPGSHPLRMLGRSLAHTMSAWQVPQTLPDDALHVQATPPISWLHFHQADLAIAAGDKALETYIPHILRALNKIDVADLGDR